VIADHFANSVTSDNDSVTRHVDVLFRKISLSRSLAKIPASHRAIGILGSFLSEAEAGLAAAEEAIKHLRHDIAASCLDRAEQSFEQYLHVLKRDEEHRQTSLGNPWITLGLEFLLWGVIVLMSMLLTRLQGVGQEFIGSFGKWRFNNGFCTLGFILYFILFIFLWRVLLRERSILLFHRKIRWRIIATLLACVGAFFQSIAIVIEDFSVTGLFTTYNNGLLYEYNPLIWPLFALAYPIIDLIVTRRRRKRNEKDM
jgi:hypothetical protein